MGSLLGSSTISQSPFLQSLPPSFQTTTPRKHGRKKMAITVSMQPENPNDTNFMKRRGFLLVGLSVAPILQSRARAVEDLMKGNPNIAKAEQVRQKRAPANPFLGFLNGVGIIGVGVLGALYALVQKEKASLNSTIESMTIKLNEKEATVAERMEEIRKVKEERDYLSNQLASANRALTGLQQDFQSEKTLAQSLREEIDHLKGVIVASLNKRVAELSKHTSEDKDARGKLERDLQEAAKSLEEMNRKALTLSRELEMANSKCANLESEKDMLAKSLAEEKNFAKEVQENIEAAHKSLTDVHVEMENLEKRSEGLQVELATAKAEIEKLKRVPSPETSQ